MKKPLAVWVWVWKVLLKDRFAVWLPPIPGRRAETKDNSMRVTQHHAPRNESRRQSGTSPRRFRPGRQMGFSLMEVTIAVSIIAFTCIPLIAMLPAGMKTMRDGQREAVGAEIVRLLTNELTCHRQLSHSTT